MAMIKGITVTLISKEKMGLDPFGNNIYQEKEIEVENVLVAPSSTDDIVTTTDLTGKKAIYTLAIPKGDRNIWEDNIVVFFGKKWHVLGFAIEGIEDNVPLDWNKKVMVERYE
mgnify:CR=1 FL=1